MSDLRFAFRLLRKQPVFSLITVITLALGIGATAAVFSLVQGVLLTPPPYRQPDRIVLIPAVRADGQPRGRGWPSAQWMEWQKEAKSFEAVAAYSWDFTFLVRPESSQSLEGMVVTREYFRATGLQPLLGRTFFEKECAPGGSPVIILGYQVWQREFHGDPQVLGKPLHLGRRENPPVVIGVMPRLIRFLPSPGAGHEPNYNVNSLVDYWLPAIPDPARMKNPGWDVVGKLRVGVIVREAQSELAVMVQREARSERDFQGFVPRVEALSRELNREGERILFPLMGAAGLVLLIACGNAAGLLLVRGLQRQQEYAVRAALGVGRLALFRQVSTESLILALLGGLLGVCLATGVVRVFQIVGGHAIPRLDAVKTGWPVLAWGLGSAVLGALLAGVFPAWRASGLNAAEALKAAGPKASAGSGARQLLRAVTMLQTALTLALLVGAGLLIRTMANLSKVQSGYDSSHLLTMTVTAINGNWVDFHRRALEKVAGLPGVRGAAFAWGVPLTGNSWPGKIEVEGQAPVLQASEKVSIPMRSVTPGYFELLGLRMAAGRDFRATDSREARSVAVVNRAFAERYFSDSSALGKKIWMDGREKPGQEIVGVVTDARTADLTQAAEPELYLSLWQASLFSKDLMIRTAEDAASLVPLVRRELRAIDPTAVIENVRTMKQIQKDSVASRTFAMQLLVGFSLVGSLLSLVGIYGVLSLSVESRQREMAVRVAVGAGRREIRRLVFGEGFRLILGGVLTGLAAALALSRVLASFLFGVEATDPATLAGMGLLFSAVALLACWAPGNRASRADPMDALRAD